MYPLKWSVKIGPHINGKDRVFNDYGVFLSVGDTRRQNQQRHYKLYVSYPSTFCHHRQKVHHKSAVEALQNHTFGVTVAVGFDSIAVGRHTDDAPQAGVSATATTR